MIEKRLLSAPELAAYTGLKVSTIRAWCCQRRLPVVKLGRKVAFDKKVIDSLIENGELGADSFEKN